MALRDYIAEALERLHTEQQANYLAEADRIIDQILDPSYTPAKAKRPTPARNVTKVKSYQEFIDQYASDVYSTIYSAVYNSTESLSRRDIATATGLRLSTVCGSVANMLAGDVLYVDGTKLDEDSNRTVETLRLTNWK